MPGSFVSSIFALKIEGKERRIPLNNWIELLPESLAANLHAIQAAAGWDTTVLAVIKANGYGHGAETCAPILARTGASWLGVTSAAEGARVRNALTAAGSPQEKQPRILVMCGFLPEHVADIREHDLTPVAWSPEQIVGLAPGTAIHVEVDTGMGRQGVTPGAGMDRLLDRVVGEGLMLEGMFTHFCSSEVVQSALTGIQQGRFEAVVAQVAARGLNPTYLHAANSSALQNRGLSPSWIAGLAASVGAKPMVRTGIALYGYMLPIEGGPAEPGLREMLQPVLIWKARVLSVRTLAAGDTVGYSAIFTARREMRVALLPVGYADGLRRELSSSNEQSGGWVMLHGMRAPILGRISMNLTVVDVTEIPRVHPGDEAVVLGPGITADDHARLAHTISYEILCGIHPCG